LDHSNATLKGGRLAALFVVRDNIATMRVLVCLCAAVLLIASCQPPETPQWAPNVERTDIAPAEWIVGCFAIDTMTDMLRAGGAHQEFQLTARHAQFVDRRQWYAIEMTGSHRAYGRWTPIAPSKVRLQVGSTGFDLIDYELSRSNEGLAGTYRLETDVSPGSGPDIPVSLHRIPCVSARTR